MIKTLDLFHGTRNTPPEQIYTSEEGFDMRFSPGGMWGRANYFAFKSFYSNAYAHPLPNGYKQMFQAKVIIGKKIKMESDKTLTMPPLIPNSQNQRYDSVKGHT